MSCPFNEEQLTQVKAFVELCKTIPSVLHHPKLLFFKDYLVSLGVVLPTATYNTKNFSASGDSNVNPKTEENIPEKQEEEEDIESDVELNMEGVITDTSLANQEMGDETKEVTEEEQDQSDEKRTEAMGAFAEQQYDEAIKLYTEAINLNPQSSLVFAKRGQVFLKQNKLHACIKDCSRALELNCDSAAGYKFRGRAYRLLGQFEEAANDLRESLKIDYDDQTNEWLNEVKPNADKLRQHNLNVQRHKGEKEHREKVKRVRKAQEARAEAAKEQPQTPTGSTGDHVFLDGLKLLQIMSIPELQALTRDPEIFMALHDISMNPANISKYQSNPKITAAIEIFLKNYNPEGEANPGAPPDASAPKPETKPETKGSGPTLADLGLD